MTLLVAAQNLLVRWSVDRVPTNASPYHDIANSQVDVFDRMLIMSKVG
jgi:hypothetical protein